MFLKSKLQDKAHTLCKMKLKTDCGLLYKCTTIKCLEKIQMNFKPMGRQSSWTILKKR
jgi:hypothetical protein